MSAAAGGLEWNVLMAGNVGRQVKMSSGEEELSCGRDGKDSFGVGC